MAINPPNLFGRLSKLARIAAARALDAKSSPPHADLCRVSCHATLVGEPNNLKQNDPVPRS